MKLDALQKHIGIHFDDITTLETAFVHRSYLNEHAGHISNERLEFLGDAVLELVITEYLYDKFPDKDEGLLTNYRSALVRGTNLAKIAASLKLGDYLRISKGEEATGGRSKHYLLANTMEALIGAIYVDRGMDVCADFIAKYIVVTFEEIMSESAYLDSKTKFQEKAQDIYEITPHYNVLEESGPDHDKVFKVGAYIGEECIAEGVGKSKQSAQEDAAKNALIAKEW